MIVMKFGGTSIQDSTCIANVAQIIKSKVSLHPIVVISAIANATNNLEEIGKLSAEGKEDEALSVLQNLLDRHVIIVEELIKDSNKKEELLSIINRTAHDIKELVKGVSILGEITPRSLDRFYSYGELLSSRLVASVLREIGLDSVWLDTKDFMITDENYTRALPIMEKVETQLKKIALPLIRQGKIIVTQGFIGITESGFRTTMGRESSDYSATIIGTALDAEDVQIWTDVDGVLTADPKIVKSPKKIKVLSFEEAYELSYLGAKVLHPNTMLPAIEKNIPIHIYNSKKPEKSGTLITAVKNSTEVVVKSVPYKQRQVLITLTPRNRIGQFIFWEQIYSILTKYSVQVNMSVTSEYSISIVIDFKNNISAIISDLNEIANLYIQSDKGIVSVVGTNLLKSRSNVNKIMNAISCYNLLLISFGASTFSVSFLLDESDIVDAVRKIHKEFFETSLDNEIFETLTD